MGLRSAVFWGLLAAAAACQAAEFWREPDTGMEFVALPKGCFKMGLPASAFDGPGKSGFLARIRTEQPEHEACLDAFWIGKYEVTAAQWRKVMGGEAAAGQDNVPAVGISWEEAETFARRLSEMSGGRERFRLPTEAEWEYACRAGAPAVTMAPGWEDLDGKAWYSSSYGKDAGGRGGNTGERIAEVQPVGGKGANAFGLHDMLGNAWEWVQDAYQPDAYSRHKLYNPVVADARAEKRVIRGGGLRTDRRMTRCETRGWMPPRETQDTLGVRLVRIGKGEKK